MAYSLTSTTRTTQGAKTFGASPRSNVALEARTRLLRLDAFPSQEPYLRARPARACMHCTMNIEAIPTSSPVIDLTITEEAGKDTQFIAPHPGQPDYDIYCSARAKYAEETSNALLQANEDAKRLIAIEKQKLLAQQGPVEREH